MHSFLGSTLLFLPNGSTLNHNLRIPINQVWLFLPTHYVLHENSLVRMGRTRLHRQESGNIVDSKRKDQLFVVGETKTFSYPNSLVGYKSYTYTQ